MGKRILWEEQNHTNTATTPFLEKEDYTTGKTTRIHSEKSRRLKRTAALKTKDPNFYIPIYSLKSWDVWVGNKAREHIILQDDT